MTQRHTWHKVRIPTQTSSCPTVYILTDGENRGPCLSRRMTSSTVTYMFIRTCTCLLADTLELQ